MFKSVFTKYVTVFMLIISISFTILAVIISSMMINFSTESKQNDIYGAANNIKSYLEGEHLGSGVSDFMKFIEINHRVIQRDISMVVRNSNDLVIIITDSAGNIIAADEYSAYNLLKESVGESYITAVRSGNYRATTDLDGVFSQTHLVHGMSVTSGGRFVGAVYVCSASTGLDELTEVMIKTIIMACMWVLLAALIAVYFISERIISPLKDMSTAAKSFAAGKFDVRVPVVGKDEIAELAVAFNNMASSIDRLEEMRSTFLANVSHDLRTPMTTISGFIDGILVGAIPPDKHEYYLNVIAGEVKRLSRLVQSLLDISRIQAGDRKFNKGPFDICEMARQILISFEQKIDAKRLNVEFDCDSDKMIAFADHDAIYQILYNICDNAVKFSREEGRYRIKINRSSRKIYVSVYNEGQGIPESDLPFVFDRFYKSDRSRGLDKSGVGLGLFIAKTIIDAHNEEIWVRSAYGEYCEFIFTLAEASDNPLKKRSESRSVAAETDNSRNTDKPGDRDS